MPRVNKFWNFVNIDENEAELYLYGPIASEKPWWDEGDTVTPQQFLEELRAVGEKKQITLRINSPGGDVYAAITITNRLREHSAEIVAKIDGLAASAASIVLCGADKVMIAPGAQIFIHDAMVGMCGWFNGDELEKVMKAHEAARKSVIAMYKEKTGKSEKELEKMLKNESWLSGQEAIDAGFVDEIMFQEEPVKLAASGNFLVVNSVAGIDGFDISHFKTRPQVANTAPAPAPVVKPKNKKEDTMDIKTVDELRQHFPALVNQIENAAVTGERKRLQDIEAISANIDPALVAAAKYDQPVDARDLAFQAAQQGAKLGNTYLANAAIDANNSGAQNVGAVPVGGQPQPEKPKNIAEMASRSVMNVINRRCGGAN